MKNKIPKLNLLSNIDEDPPKVFDKPTYLDDKKTIIDYIDLMFDNAWKIWALLIGGVILIWLAWMR